MQRRTRRVAKTVQNLLIAPIQAQPERGATARYGALVGVGPTRGCSAVERAIASLDKSHDGLFSITNAPCEVVQ